ncbi:Alpha/Beta hydrolase protein, partial [Elsinoe ampelina]
QAQSEDCLRLTLTIPIEALETSSKKLPVAVFIHGGAFMVASGERAYYDSTQLCMDALHTKQPIIFVSMNYRLNALGFMHSPEAADILPANNGLHDQIHAFEWLRTFLPGFGGNIDQITAIGQSAGAASLSLHNSVPRDAPLYRRSIVLSGSSVVLVTMTPEQHQAEFLHQADKLGIATSNRSSHDIALDIVHLPVDQIRELDMPGAPCSGTDLIPSQDWATMAHARHIIPNPWLESQLLSSCTFDGSISYMVALSQTRKNLAATFQAICKNRLKDPTRLLDIYNITTTDNDQDALEKICQIVTDTGFFNAAISHAKGAQLSSPPTPTYLQLFDLPNPFAGLLPSHRFATHTWDIVALLGPFDHLIPPHVLTVIKSWRQEIITYVTTGTWSCPAWTPEDLSTFHVGTEGLRCLGREEMEAHRASKLMEYAETQGGEAGADMLWEDVVRFFLKTG